MTRRFAVAQTPKSNAHSLAARLSGAQRLPLDLALSLAVEVVDVVAAAHQRKQAYGRLSAADFQLLPTGALEVTVPVAPEADVASNTFDVGAVLYQLFTGLTPNQARARLAVSPLHEVPSAALINPAIEDTLEGLLALMLDRDPAKRPHSLRVIEALLVDVCESVELEPSRAAIAAWAAAAPVVAAPPAPRHVPSFVVLADDDVEEVDDELEEDDEQARPSPRLFDLWTVAAGAFCVVAFALATHL